MQFKLSFEQPNKGSEEGIEVKSIETIPSDNSLNYLSEDILNDLYSGNDNADMYKK